MNGKTSSTKDMPGGGPQGTVLGLLIFIIAFNFAGTPSTSSNIGEELTIPKNKQKPMKNNKCKNVDDLTIAKSINLKSELKTYKESELVRPLQFHERTKHILPNDKNEMQSEVHQLELYFNEHKMKINSKKTKAMIFNSRMKTDFMPKLFLQDGYQIEVVGEIKLLGIIITSDLKWGKNTKKHH